MLIHLLLSVAICLIYIFIHAQSQFISYNKHDNDVIHIIYSLDIKMLSLFMISVVSIIQNSINPERLYFHIVLIDMEWDEKLLNELTYILTSNHTYKSKFEAISWNPIPNIIKTIHIRGTRQELASPANYARLYVSSIFKNSNIDRYIYLDNDIIAIKPIEKLWNLDLQGNIIGMAEDCFDGIESNFYSHVVKEKKYPNYNLTHPIVLEAFNYTYNYTCYPNAGVMLVDQSMFTNYDILSKIGLLIYIIYIKISSYCIHLFLS